MCRQRLQLISLIEWKSRDETCFAFGPPKKANSGAAFWVAMTWYVSGSPRTMGNSERHVSRNFAHILSQTTSSESCGAEVIPISPQPTQSMAEKGCEISPVRKSHLFLRRARN